MRTADVDSKGSISLDAEDETEGNEQMEDPEFNELNLDIEVLKQYCHLASATDSLHRAHKWYRHDQEGYQVRGREHIKIAS